MTLPEIDPAVVRTIAEAALYSTISDDRAERVEAALIASGVAGPVVGEKFDAWSKAVGAEYERLESEQSTKARATNDPDRAGAKPTAAEQAAEHLIEKLQKMHADAMRVATSQEAAAEGTNSYKRQIGHEESAAFHRALASEIDKVLYKLRARADGYPGVPGDGWRDSEGDVWVLCADGMMRMLYTDPMPWDPEGLPGEYGPMEPAGYAPNEGGGDVPCLWCHCDGCDECAGEGGVVCGCRNTVQR